MCSFGRRTCGRSLIHTRTRRYSLPFFRRWALPIYFAILWISAGRPQWEGTKLTLPQLWWYWQDSFSFWWVMNYIYNLLVIMHTSLPYGFPLPSVASFASPCQRLINLRNSADLEATWISMGNTTDYWTVIVTLLLSYTKVHLILPLSTSSEYGLNQVFVVNGAPTSRLTFLPSSAPLSSSPSLTQTIVYFDRFLDPRYPLPVNPCFWYPL